MNLVQSVTVWSVRSPMHVEYMEVLEYTSNVVSLKHTQHADIPAEDPRAPVIHTHIHIHIHQ